MRITEETNHLLFQYYESGIDNKTACDIFGLSKDYPRTKGRELITSYINKFVRVVDNKHPLLTLFPLQTRQLIELLQEDSKGIKTNITSSELPGIW